MKELLSGLIGPVTGIIDKVVADKDQAAKRAHDIATIINIDLKDFILNTKNTNRPYLWMTIIQRLK